MPLIQELPEASSSLEAVCQCRSVPRLAPPEPAPSDPLDYVFEAQVPAPYYYFLDQFECVQPGYSLKYISAYRAAVMTLCGWTRVLLCDSVTGKPDTFLQLWRVPAPLHLDQTYARLRRSPECRDFFANVKSFDREILYPMTYDPMLSGENKLDESIRELSIDRETPFSAVLLNHISVKSGAMEAFSCAKQKHFIPFVESLDWKLISAASLLNGSPGRVVQCWLLPDPNSLIKTMRAIVQSSDYRNCVKPCIEAERQELFELRAGV